VIVQQLSLLLFDVTFRRLWALGCAILLPVTLVLDFYSRQMLAEAGFGPTDLEVWLSVAYGFGAGLAIVTLESRNLSKHPDFWMRFCAAELKDRLKWRFQRWNLRYCAWVAVLTAPIFVWGLARFALILPAITAMGIPMGLWVGKPIREFEQKLRNHLETHSAPSQY
jgi:hypothetical protein